MHNILTVENAISAIEKLANKLRGIALPLGNLSAEGRNIRYNQCKDYDGEGEVPAELTSFMNFLNDTNGTSLTASQALTEMEDERDAIIVNSTLTDNLYYDAVIELKALDAPTIAEIVAVYEDHLDLFEDEFD